MDQVPTTWRRDDEHGQAKPTPRTAGWDQRAFSTGSREGETSATTILLHSFKKTPISLAAVTKHSNDELTEDFWTVDIHGENTVVTIFFRAFAEIEDFHRDLGRLIHTLENEPAPAETPETPVEAA